MTDAPRSSPTNAGSAYFALPDAGRGPGVLVLHSWWGLTDGIRRWCDHLAEEGFVVLAPDLLGGALPATEHDARAVLAGEDVNRAADLILSSTATLRLVEHTGDGPVGVVGFAMGASWALWLASRAPDHVGAVTFFYGSQEVDHLDINVPVLGHFAEHDSLVDQDERVLLEAALMLGGHPVDIHHYPTTAHGFAEPVDPAFDADATELATQRTVDFLRANLEGPST